MADAKTVKEAKEAELVVEATPATTGEASITPDTTTEGETPKTTAKAGKRSAKAQKEAEVKAEKEARKAQSTQEEGDEEKKPKQTSRPTRSRLERQGKKFREAAKQIDKTKVYPLEEALALAAKTSPVKFDASVELHINLSVDPRQADQNVRDTLVLPAGTGKTVRVAVFADVDDVATAKKAGADITGIEEITKLLDKGQLDFDILIATPTQMAKLGKYARVLGPRGLMPNPKSGTVTPNIEKAVTEAKAGRVEYRVDSTGIIHLSIGKVSFGTDKLMQNAQAVLASIRQNKPASVKGTYLKNIHLTTTMGPSIKVETTVA